MDRAAEAGVRSRRVVRRFEHVVNLAGLSANHEFLRARWVRAIGSSWFLVGAVPTRETDGVAACSRGWPSSVSPSSP